MSSFDLGVLFRHVMIPLMLGLGGLMMFLAYVRHSWRIRFLFLFRAAVITGIAVLAISPTLSWETADRTTPEIHVAVDLSRSMALTDRRKETRFERARRIVRQIEKSYGGSFLVRVFGFGSRVRAIPDWRSVEPVDPGTDLTEVLKSRGSSTDKSRLRALFVVSDGRTHSRENHHMWARTSEIPIHTIGVGRENYDYQDAAIERVEAPDTVFRDSRVEMRVEVSTIGRTGTQRLPVTLRRLGHPGEASPGEVLQERPVELSDGRGTAVFSFAPDLGGVVEYEVSIPEEPGELWATNNRRIVPVLVEHDPRSILLLSGHPSWESAFLRRVVSSDPRFSMSVRELVAEGTRHEFDVSEIARVRLVILDAFRRDDFRPDQIQALVDFVTRGQGALWVIGLEPDRAEELHESPLGQLLPAGRPAASGPPDKRLHLVLSPLGARHPIMKVSGHPQANALAWKNLPPIAPGAAFPLTGAQERGAHVLATFPFYPDDLVAISYRYRGSGLVALTATWELHLLKLLPAAARDEEHVYRKFVSNLLDWITDRASSHGVALNLGKPRYMQGEPVTLEVNDYLGGISAPEVRVTFERLGAKEPGRTLRLAKDGDDFTGRIELDEPGAYAFTLEVPGKGTIVRHAFVDAQSRELAHPFADFEALRDISSQSGGAFFTEKEEAWRKLPIDASPLVNVSRTNLYWVDEWKLLFMILVLLSAEWVLRRRWNLM